MTRKQRDNLTVGDTVMLVSNPRDWDSMPELLGRKLECPMYFKDLPVTLKVFAFHPVQPNTSFALKDMETGDIYGCNISNANMHCYVIPQREEKCLIFIKQVESELGL